MVSTFAFARTALICSGLAVIGGCATAPTQPGPGGGEPAWRTQMIFWEAEVSDPRPWEADARLHSSGIDGFPADYLVWFLNPDSLDGSKHEAMWVTTIAFDRSSDCYLGFLLNDPLDFPGLSRYDNVVYCVEETEQHLFARIEGGRYDQVGWPRTAAPEFRDGLVRGIRAYRGARGGDRERFAECVETLSPLMDDVPSEATMDERYVGHFVLGRCLGDAVRTEEAAVQLRRAIDILPGDVHAHMALLAELAVLRLSSEPSPDPELPAAADRAYREELQVIRTRFGSDPRVLQLAVLILNDGADTGPVDSLTDAQWAELADRRAFFRWQVREPAPGARPPTAQEFRWE